MFRFERGSQRTILGPKYVLYSYMDPLGDVQSFRIGVGGPGLLIQFGAWSLSAEAFREDVRLLGIAV